MAIIYTYPNLPLSSLSADDLLVITNVDANNNNPTKSVTLADIATYVTGTGSGTGTTNKIVKFTDGANGLLGDSIMTESTGLIDLAGQFVSTSSPTLTQAGPVSGIKAILNGTTAAPNVALYGESINTGSTQANSNYGLFAKGEFEGTAGFTGFVIGGNLEGRYDGTGTNGANATVYGSYNLAKATTAANGTVSYMVGANNLAKLEGANVTATHLQATHSTVELSNGTAGEVIVQLLDFDTTGGGTVTGDLSYLKIQNDTMPTVAGTSRAINSLSVLPSLFTGQVEIPLVPTINAHATSKQYVDQQISSVVSGLVFQSTWDASSTPGGNPDLTEADKKVVGHYYVVSVAGNATPNGAGTEPSSWNVGDWCIYVEQGATDRWEKLDQTFVSGAGAAGQVTYWNSQNEVAGDNDLFFDSTNKRLGIGTSSPQRDLHVNSSNVQIAALIESTSTTSAQLNFKNGSTTGNGGFIKTTGDNIILTANSSGEKHLVVANGGNVGIRTTSPLGKLQVNEYIVGSQGNQTVHGELSVFANNGDESLYLGVKNAAYPNRGWAFNPVITGVNSDLQIKEHGQTGVRMTLQAGGNVGIGTTSPTSKLHISSDSSTTVNIEAKNPTAFNDPVLNFVTWNEASGSSSGKIQLTNGTFNSNDMAFFTETANSVTEKMRINSSGNVGIGTDNPQSGGGSAGWLSLNGTAAYSGGIVYTISSTTKAYSYFESDYLKQQAQSGFGQKFIVDGTNTAMTILNSGDVGIGTTSPLSKLHVAGDITFGDSHFIGDDSFDNLLILSSSGENVVIQAPSGNSIDLKTAGGSTLNLDSSQNATFAGTVNFETGSEVTGIISSNTDEMEFRVGDGISISSAKQLKIDTGGIEVTGDIDVTNSSDGLILKSPDGTRYRVTVANGGTLSVSAV